jgi:DNA polymerase III beta subunit
MKLQCNRKQFYDALGVVAGAAEARASLPILSHVYIEAQSDAVRLVGSDLEQWVECRIPALVGEDGATTLPARLLTELVGSLGGEDIHIESGERHQTVLTSGDSRYQLMGLPAEEYPPIPDIESPSELALPASLLRDMVKSVGFAVAPKGLNAALTGIRMEFDGDTLRLAATDTHRLAVRTARIDSVADEPIAAIVPLKAIQLVRKIPVGETITLQLGQHRAAFLGENAAVYTQLIEGQYPNYQRLIPQEYTRRWVLMVEGVPQRAAARLPHRKKQLHCRSQDLHQQGLSAHGWREAADYRAWRWRRGDRAIELGARRRRPRNRFQRQVSARCAGCAGERTGCRRTHRVVATRRRQARRDWTITCMSIMPMSM